MKKILLASACLLALTGAASAADLAARPYTKAPVAVASVYNWTGFYLGIVGGGAWEAASRLMALGLTSAPPPQPPFPASVS